MRRGRRETKVVLQCADEADQISVLDGFLKPPTLENGSVVLALLPRNLPRSCGGTGGHCAPPDFCEQTEAVTWLHSGLMNFSPYEPSCQMLDVSPKQPAVSSLSALRATGRFVSAQPCVASMRMDCMWFGRLFALWSSEYLLAEVQASEVWVTSLMKPVLFWTAGKRMRKADPSATGRGRGR